MTTDKCIYKCMFRGDILELANILERVAFSVYFFRCFPPP
jgi:hypothetical protein